MIDVRAIVSTLIARIRRRPFPYVLEKPTAQEAPGSTIAPYPLASVPPKTPSKRGPPRELALPASARLPIGQKDLPYQSILGGFAADRNRGNDF